MHPVSSLQPSGKGKVTYIWYSASSWIITSEALRNGTCSQGISQFYLHTHTFSPQSEWAIPAFAFPAIAGTNLPIQEGRKAELAWVAGTGWDSLRARRQSPITILTRGQLRWSRTTRYRYTKPPG